MIVGEVFPGRAIWRVVFAHRAPGAFAQVGAPTHPIQALEARFLQPNFFARHSNTGPVRGCLGSLVLMGRYYFRLLPPIPACNNETNHGSSAGRSYPVKVRDLIRVIERDGWRQVRTRGSHRQYKHPVKRGRVTVPGHPGDDVHPDTLKSVLSQAGLKGKP